MSTLDFSRPSDRFAILRRVPMFGSCTDEQLQFIAGHTRLVEYKKGECIYKEGDPATALYIVSSGRLRVFTQVGTTEQTLTIFHNGDSFGEVSLLTDEVHSVTVQALNDTLVFQLEKAEFEQVINRIPSLVLYLSRQLSKRLRTKERGGEYAEATIVALYSAAQGVGRTSFAAALASSLTRETGQSVVLLDLTGSSDESAWLFGSLRPRSLQRESEAASISDEALDAAVAGHPLGFQVLRAGDVLAEPGGEQLIAPLLSALANRFHYMLIDLPVGLNSAVLKALVQSDLIYVMTEPGREHLIRTSALLHQLRSAIGSVEQRLKVILNLREVLAEPVSVASIAQQLKYDVAFVLPNVPSTSGPLTSEELARVMESRTSPYTMTVRRIARQLSGLLVGLALGSGAALGLAHIGVLKVIERERIPIDLIAGSSIGALIGALWASGRSAEELEQMALDFKRPWDIRKLFLFDFGIPIFSVLIGIIAGIGIGWLAASFWTGLLFGLIVCVAIGIVFGPLSGGPMQGARLMAKLQSDFAGKTFEDTWLPLKVVAANPVAREEVVFESGSLAEAVRASVSIPGIFKPVMRQGKLCLDGGVVNPIPVSVLKRAGAHHVIGVNVFPTTQELMASGQELQHRRVEREAQMATRSLPIRLLVRVRQELIRSITPLVFDVIMRSMQTMEYQIAEVACREADLTLRPTVPGSHWLEFFSPEKFIRRGEEVALQYLPELKRIARGATH